MDLSDPTRAITPTLDGTVLAVLAASGRPLTVGEVAALASRGSEIGIRRSLGRLVEQGTVRATIVGRNRVHELNREHVAARVADVLAGLRLELWRRLREEVAQWPQTPLYAAVFGSAARGDGGADSDIDLLLVHTPFPGEAPPRLTGDKGLSVLATIARAYARQYEADADPEQWLAQVDRLRDLVQRWTGNQLQVVDLSAYEWIHPSPGHGALLAAVRRDAVEIARSDKLPFAAPRDLAGVEG